MTVNNTTPQFSKLLFLLEGTFQEKNSFVGTALLLVSTALCFDYLCVGEAQVLCARHVWTFFPPESSTPPLSLGERDDGPCSWLLLPIPYLMRLFGLGAIVGSSRILFGWHESYPNHIQQEGCDTNETNICIDYDQSDGIGHFQGWNSQIDQSCQ